MDQKPKEIRDYIEEIRMPALKKKMLKLLDDYEEKLRANPAAIKFHHAYEGGLYDHTKEVIEIALSIFELYKDRFIREVRRDDIILVAFAHDLEKVGKYVRNMNQATLLQGQNFAYNYSRIDANDTARIVSILAKYDIELSEECLNAATFSHGSWSKDKGKMLPLATILHMADMLSIATERRNE